MDSALRENQASAATDASDTPYSRAATGFKNYWYPILDERSVGRRPKRMVLLGEPIALVRRGKRIYAVQDECPHRGARLSLGKDEFPGTDTLACRFHGWTFDLKDGRCVAALTDGPDSPVVGKVRVRTFPVEQRKGIVFLWMGRGAPVPLEEDIPALLLREDTKVKVRYRQVYGNWRQHAEGSAGGHFFMLHRDAIALLNHRLGAYNATPRAELQEYDPVDKRMYLLETNADFTWGADYLGLGNWPPQRPWRRSKPPNRRAARGTSTEVQGIKHIGISLPGFLRVRHFPQNGAVYYEWYIAIDAHHYFYMQLSGHWPKNILHRAWINLWYNAWAGPMRKGHFNNQDKSVVQEGTDFEDRQGVHRPTPLFRPDVFPRRWIQMCNAYARGEGWKVTGQQAPGKVKAEEIPLFAGASDTEPLGQ
jgi:phenylpropionate dioxygenase-like ring-hydroxylating dioxygenase large terminal subunit